MDKEAVTSIGHTYGCLCDHAECVARREPEYAMSEDYFADARGTEGETPPSLFPSDQGVMDIAPRPEKRDVELSLLPDNEDLVGPEPSKGLLASVATVGILQPVVLTREVVEREGPAEVFRYRVEAGRRRIKAARQVGLSNVPAVIFPEGWATPGTMTVAENELRSRNDLALLDAIGLLEAGTSPEELRKIPGVTQALMLRVQLLRRLNPALLAAVRAGEMSLFVGKRAANLPPALQAELVTVFHDTGTLTAADCDTLLERSRGAQPALPLPEVGSGGKQEAGDEQFETIVPGAATGTAVGNFAGRLRAAIRRERLTLGDEGWLPVISVLLAEVGELVPDSYPGKGGIVKRIEKVRGDLDAWKATGARAGGGGR